MELGLKQAATERVAASALSFLSSSFFFKFKDDNWYLQRVFMPVVFFPNPVADFLFVCFLMGVVLVGIFFSFFFFMVNLILLYIHKTTEEQTNRHRNHLTDLNWMLHIPLFTWKRSCDKRLASCSICATSPLATTVTFAASSLLVPPTRSGLSSLSYSQKLTPIKWNTFPELCPPTVLQLV